jgi:hypothetical protein
MTRTRTRTVLDRGLGLGPGAGRDRRRRLWIVVVAAVVLLAAAAGGWWLLRGDGSTGVEGVHPSGPHELLAIGVLAGDEALVAVVGAGGDAEPAAVTIPGRTLVEIPGAGSGTVEAAARLPGDLFSLTVANLFATEVHHHAVLDLEALAASVDASGGVTLDVAGTLEVNGQRVGPGPTAVGGIELRTYLAESPRVSLEDRWIDVVVALLDGDLAFDTAAAVQTVDLGAVNDVIAAADGAVVVPLPVEIHEGRLVRADEAALPAFLHGVLGVDAGPAVEVLVLNGNGSPGMGELVARRIVGSGFRVVASGNARAFDVEVTEVRVSDPSLRAAGEEVRRLLGVGTLIVTEQGSGLAPITVVMGHDVLDA